jgi:hypothetical protein
VARRLDVIVFLTDEAEFPDLIEPLQRSVRIDWCIGAADYAISIGTLWRRLTPFALIIARAAPRPYLLGIAAIARHALRVAAPVAPGADASRRDFSAERRLATNAISDLLGRVQRWS